MQVVERLDEVLRAPPPAAELGDEDSVNLAGSGQSQDLGPFGPGIVSARGRLLENCHDLMARTLGEGAQIPFLALARLVVSRDPAIDGPLSQLNPSRIRF